jgi:hypothetical protein
LPFRVTSLISTAAILHATKMTEIATSDRSMPRAAIAVAALFGALMALALALWGYYGTAVFTEMILAGLAACF